MPFNFQSMPEVALPLGGLFPQARQMDPRAAAQAAWLNSGGRAPVTAPAIVPNTDEWTDEDNIIAVMSGADPMGVREAFERYRGVNDEKAFIEGLGKINWRDPASKSQVGELLTRFPRGVTQKGLGIMQLLDKLEGTEKDVYRPQVAELGTEYLQAYDNAIKGGADKETALAQATTLRQKNLVAEKTKTDLRSKFVEAGGDLEKFDELSGKFGSDWAGYRDYLNKNKPLAKLEAGERKALTEAYDNYRATLAGIDEAATDDAKIAAFTKAKGRAPQTNADWEEAYNLVKESMVAPAITQIADLADLYEGKALPEVITRLVKPTGSLYPETQAPAGTPMPAPAPVGTPIVPGAPTPTISAPPAPTSIVPPPALPAPAPAAPISPADLKRIEPVTFESLAAQVADRGASERAAAAAAKDAEKLTRQKEEQAYVDATAPKWEEAKMSLLQRMDASDVRNLRTGGGFTSEAELRNMVSRLTGGKAANEQAFVDSRGKPVAWIEVMHALRGDPRMKEVMKGGSPATAPSAPVTTQQQQQLLASLPQVTTREAYAALAPGTEYVDSNGKRARKK